MFRLLLAFSLLFCPKIVASPFDDLPQEPQGQFPIHHPSYDGVAALLPLTAKWVIVVTENIEEIAAEIDRLSDGEYLIKAQSWADTQFGDYPDWSAHSRLSALQHQYMDQARNTVGEKELNNPASFSITSADDPNYNTPQYPLRTTRYIASLGGRRIVGGPDLHFAHYNYLELPHPLKDGAHYTITVRQNKKVDFLYDEKATVSRAIKTNQIGYLPSATNKYAYISGYLQNLGPLVLPENTPFKVINADTGQEALTGPVTLRAANPKYPAKERETAPTPMFGENIYEIDFSNLKQEGNFFITVPGVGRSWPFRHAEDVYGEVFYIAARGLYHQRCGTAIEEKHTAWPRPSCHNDPVYESDNITFIPPYTAPKGYDRFDVIAATIDRSQETQNPEGGWHDAADFDRNSHHYTCILDLLGLFEMFPDKFKDGQLNIPESGNGTPDILDEAEYGLKAWRKSMTPEGGVAGAIETWTHARIDDPNIDYAYSQRTRWDSLLYAGAAATYAHLIKPFNANLAKTYADSALKAYEYGTDPQNAITKTTFKATKKRGKGSNYTIEWENKEDNLIPYIIFASLRLFILTQDESYLKKIALLSSETPPPYKYPFRYQNFSPWLYYGFLHPTVREKNPPNITQFWERTFRTAATELWRHSRTQPYRHSWPFLQNYWLAWGNSCMTNQARCLLIADPLSEDSNYQQAALYNADFMLGNNPLGMVWTTGLGYCYPIDIQHGISETDEILDPIPGITIYGITDNLFWDLTNTIWQKETTPPPLWRRFFAHPHRNTPQNEFTIHETMSSTIFTAGALMPHNWMPSEALRNKRPRREDRLYGLYYLP